MKNEYSQGVKGLLPSNFNIVENNVPEWLKNNKVYAWDNFNTLTANIKREKFKNIIESLDFSNLEFSSAFSEPTNISEFRKTWKKLSASFILNGSDKNNFIDEELIKKGVILKPLSLAMIENEDLVKPYLTKLNISSKDSRFISLAESMWLDGIFLYIPKDLDILLPIHLLRYINKGNTQNYYKNLIVIDSNSKVTLINESISKDTDAPFLVDGVTEIHVKENSHVSSLYIQNFDYNAFNFSLRKAHVGKNSTLKTLSISIGSKFSYEGLKTYAEGDGSHIELLGLVIGEKEQVFQTETLQYHPNQNTYSNLHYEVMLKGKSRSAFNGFIEIEKQGKKTDAYQLCRNLLLSENAKAEAIPNLEILADDVKCSHGVSIGPVDSEQLFYLMSRGFTKQEAENLVIEGIIEAVISKIDDESLSERLRDFVLENFYKE